MHRHICYDIKTKLFLSSMSSVTFRILPIRWPLTQTLLRLMFDSACSAPLPPPPQSGHDTPLHLLGIESSLLLRQALTRSQILDAIAQLPMCCCNYHNSTAAAQRSPPTTRVTAAGLLIEPASPPSFTPLPSSQPWRGASSIPP